MAKPYDGRPTPEVSPTHAPARAAGTGTTGSNGGVEAPKAAQGARPRSVAPRERSGPIGISSGDFATPIVRRRTTTQPRGIPVVAPPTPPDDSPFSVPPPRSEPLNEAAALAAEAAAVRALDLGPGTPPPELFESPAPVSAAPAGDPATSPSGATTDGGISMPPPFVPPGGEAATFVPEPTVPDLGDLPTPSPERRADSVPADPELLASRSVTDPATPPPAPAAARHVPAFDPAPETGRGEPPRDQPFGANHAFPEVPPIAARVIASEPGPPSRERERGDEDEVTEVPIVFGETPPPDSVFADGTVAPAMALSDASARGRDGASVDPPLATEEFAVEDSGPLAPEEIAAEEGDVPPALGTPTPPPIPVSVFKAPEPGQPPPPPAPPTGVTGLPPPAPSGPPRPAEEGQGPLLPGLPILPEALAQRPRRPKRSKPWFEEVFDEDYLRTLPYLRADQTLKEVEFIAEALNLAPGAEVLDVGCGYGRHAIELVQRGMNVTGLDLSLPLLIRAADEAQRRSLSVNFVHADMREMSFERQFDGAYSMLTSFGYFDEEANLRVAERVAKSLKPGGRFLIQVMNRDYVVRDLPARVWWQGTGCVVLEEVDFNFQNSRLITHRSIVFEDGRHLEHDISVRAYSLHELGRLLRQAGFRVTNVSGSLATRGHFLGTTSRDLLLVAEKREED